MPAHYPKQGLPLEIVEVDPALGCADCQQRVVRVERHRTDVGLVQVAQLRDLAGRIQIDFVVEADSQWPTATPIHQVQVIVIQQFRGIQDFFGGQTNTPLAGPVLGLCLPTDHLVDTLIKSLRGFGHATVV